MKLKRNTGMAAKPRARITLRFIRATDELSLNPLSFCRVQRKGIYSTF